MHQFEDNVLNLRIRMPIVDKEESKNFITKIKGFSKICSVENSMTVLPELLPIMLDMSKNKITGTFNFTNPGTISHDRILKLWEKIKNEKLDYKLVSLNDMDSILVAKRSNNKLNTNKLLKLYPNIHPIEESVINCIERI